MMLDPSGGGCDGSSPMCYWAGEFKLGARDTDLTLDVVPGRGAGFSFEVPEGVRFLIRSDVCKI